MLTVTLQTPKALETEAFYRFLFRYASSGRARPGGYLAMTFDIYGVLIKVEYVGISNVTYLRHLLHAGSLRIGWTSGRQFWQQAVLDHTTSQATEPVLAFVPLSYIECPLEGELELIETAFMLLEQSFYFHGAEATIIARIATPSDAGRTSRWCLAIGSSRS